MNHSPSDARPGQRIDHGELIVVVDEAKRQLNAQHHSYELAELVVIFPSNVWEYDVLDYFPFSTPEAKAMAEEARKSKTQR